MGTFERSEQNIALRQILRAAMTKEQAIEKLKECKRPGDADKILCEFLTALGYADVVAEWQHANR